ncbi:site-specific DNA-methyltransferase [Moraxella haemolytica]|uniref:DNA-methyltransferase n=1 Tax=Moraxella haemolytica TaxID=2904119 RepID=UPI0025429897|nr:site-specific DNA-methyltransferase [Moraxella sp. ZY171148]WII94722.1 site-specific DNA-methyltransferase [Moraxella sp. ZY171148]
MNIDLHQGDCLDILKQIPDGSVDMVLTDPPYGINYQSSHRYKVKKFDKILNDETPFTQFIAHLPRLLSKDGCGMIFTRWDKQQIFIDELKSLGINPKNIIIWDKVAHGMGDLKRAFGSRYESIIFYCNHGFRFNGKRPTDIVRFNRIGGSLIHPNQKPIELLQYLIEKYTRPNATILDCFMGSGSTGVACVGTGRNFIGIELDDHYFSVAKNRINNQLNEQEIS